MAGAFDVFQQLPDIIVIDTRDLRARALTTNRAAGLSARRLLSPSRRKAFTSSRPLPDLRHSVRSFAATSDSSVSVVRT